MALTTPIRRTTITTHDMDESMRFWCDGLGFTVWYDQVVEDPVVTRLLGVKPGTSVRVAILEAETGDTGKIGLMQFLGAETSAPPTPRSGPPETGDVVILFQTEQMNAIHQRLKALGFEHVGAPEVIEIPGRETTYEMSVREPTGTRITFVQFGELD